MKKFLSTALALGVVAGLAATASAMELKVTGKYVVDGYYIDQGNGAAGKPSYGVWPFKDDDAEADSFYEHTFQLYPTLVINDKISMKGDIRLIDRVTVWGTQDDIATADGGNFNVDKAWMLYNSPVGLIEIGRRPAGAWQGAFVNSATKGDRIMWNFPAMDAFKSYVFLEKQVELDGYWGDLENNDKDYYEAAGGYEAEGVKAWLGLGWTQDNTNDIDVFGSDYNAYRVKGYGEFAINETFGLASEFDYKWGTREFNMAGVEDQDTEGLAFILSGTGKFGALAASLHYAYISGDDSSTDDLEAYDVANGMGWDFEPLYILTGNATNILNGYRGANVVGSTVRAAGAHAIVALADYAASEDLTLHGGIGWGQADETEGSIDEEYGWEVDLGLAYKLYDNLTYELHFGWWAVGDFAELGDLMETEDVLLLSHHLSMKF
jgi:hypothetical protein